MGHTPTTHTGLEETVTGRGNYWNLYCDCVSYRRRAVIRTSVYTSDVIFYTADRRQSHHTSVTTDVRRRHSRRWSRYGTDHDSHHLPHERTAQCCGQNLCPDEWVVVSLPYCLFHCVVLCWLYQLTKGHNIYMTYIRQRKMLQSDIDSIGGA